MKKIFIILVAVIGFAILSLLIWAFFFEDHAVFDRKLKAAISSGSEVNMQEITSFEWDTLYVFGAYTGQEYIDEVLGFETSLEGPLYDELELLVFVKNGEVVFSTSFGRYPVDFLDEGERHDIFLSDEVIFSLSDAEVIEEKDVVDDNIVNVDNSIVNPDQVIDLCNDAAIINDIGNEVYPIDQKYGELNFLGQLFTAYDCGSARVSKVFGVEGDSYVLGSAIWLENNPSKSLIDTFKSIGFECGEESSDKKCKEWELWGNVLVEDLMKLEPYHETFEADDCRDCG